MKSNYLRLNVLIFVFLAIALTACGSTVSEDTELLIDKNQKYSVLYPADFNVEFYGSNGVAIVRGTRADQKGARADINLLPTGSLNTQGVREEYVADYPNSELTTSTITIDNEEAVVIDGVPGKEVNRVVLIVHGDDLFKLNFTPGDPKDRDYREMEALYKVIIESFDFDPEP